MLQLKINLNLNFRAQNLKLLNNWPPFFQFQVDSNFDFVNTTTNCAKNDDFAYCWVEII